MPPAKLSSGAAITGTGVDAYKISASEAPHLLLPSNERKPFISARQFRSFSISALVGATCVGSVYLLLSQTIAESSYRDRQAISEFMKIHRPVPLDVELKASKDLPQFTAPSSYESLVADVRRGQKPPSLSQEEGKAFTPVPLLHEQAAKRFRFLWNSVVANIEMALDESIVQYYSRREQQAKKSIEQQLNMQGLQLHSLKVAK